MLVRELNNKLQSIDLEEMVREAVRANEELIVNLNRSQMNQGKNAQGQTIGYYRSLSYANFKKQLGSKSPFRVPDLKLTGAFQGDMVLVVEGDEYELLSTDEKAPGLVERYSDQGQIFGLTKENKELAKQANTKTLGDLIVKAIK